MPHFKHTSFQHNSHSLHPNLFHLLDFFSSRKVFPQLSTETHKKRFPHQIFVTTNQLHTEYLLSSLKYSFAFGIFFLWQLLLFHPSNHCLSSFNEFFLRRCFFCSSNWERIMRISSAYNSIDVGNYLLLSVFFLVFGNFLSAFKSRVFSTFLLASIMVKHFCWLFPIKIVSMKNK